MVGIFYLKKGGNILLETWRNSNRYDGTLTRFQYIIAIVIWVYIHKSLESIVVFANTDKGWSYFSFAYPFGMSTVHYIGYTLRVFTCLIPFIAFFPMIRKRLRVCYPEKYVSLISFFIVLPWGLYSLMTFWDLEISNHCTNTLLMTSGSNDCTVSFFGNGFYRAFALVYSTRWSVFSIIYYSLLIPSRKLTKSEFILSVLFVTFCYYLVVEVFNWSFTIKWLIL